MDFRDWYISTYGVGNDFERIVAKAAWDTALKHSNEIKSLREQLINTQAVVASVERERDENDRLHKAAVSECRKSFVREEKCRAEMKRRDARGNKPRTSSQVGWDELRRQLAAMTKERDNLKEIKRKLIAEKFKITTESSVLLEECGVDYQADDQYSFVYHTIELLKKTMEERDELRMVAATGAKYVEELAASQARLATYREALEKVDAAYDRLSDGLQSDLENGGKWLNEQAAQKFRKEYPGVFSAFEILLDASTTADKALAIPAPQTALNNAIAETLEHIAGNEYGCVFRDDLRNYAKELREMK